MATVTYRTSGVSPGANGTSIVINAPTGIVVGDLLIATLHVSTNPSTNSLTGWTSIKKTVYSSGPGGTLETFYKVADSGDAAAGTFTFTCTSARNIGFIMRFDGQNSGTFLDTPSDGSSTGATQTCTGHTYTFDNYLMVIVSGSYSSALTFTHTVGGSNQTVTERQDINTTNCSVAGSTVVPDAGQASLASGTVTSTRSSSSDQGAVQAFMIIPSPTDATVAVSAAQIAVVAPTIVPALAIPTGPVSISVTPVSPTMTATDSKWNDLAKNSASATNTAKNAATATNTAKNSASVTNLPKS